MSTAGDLVDQYAAKPDAAIVGAIKELAQADPVLCRQVTEAVKRKLYCSVPAEQRGALELLEKLVDTMDLTFQQIVNEKEFLSALEKIITRDSGRSELSLKTKVLMEKWVRKFANEQDILPNFSIYHSRLVEQGIVEPLVATDANPAPDGQVMDHYLLNEAEGQDPEEFKAEVKETLKLFDEVFNTIKAGGVSGADEVSRREALISLAANLDRYSEQFGLWIEQLEPGPYMEDAMALNDKVTEALQKYKLLRSSALRSKKDVSSEEDDSSEDSSDDD
jgi:hypothetical protein